MLVYSPGSGPLAHQILLEVPSALPSSFFPLSLPSSCPPLQRRGGCGSPTHPTSLHEGKRGRRGAPGKDLSPFFRGCPSARKGLTQVEGASLLLRVSASEVPGRFPRGHSRPCSRCIRHRRQGEETPNIQQGRWGRPSAWGFPVFWAKPWTRQSTASCPANTSQPTPACGRCENSGENEWEASGPCVGTTCSERRECRDPPGAFH